MYIHFFIGFAVVINTLLGLSILMRNRSSHANKMFAVMVVSLNLWMLSNFLENEVTWFRESILETFLRLDFVFGLYFFYYWFQFCTAFVESPLGEKKFSWISESLFVFITLFSAVILLTPWVITDIYFLDSIIHFTSGPVWILYTVCLLVMVVLGVGVLVHAQRWFLKQGMLLRRSQARIILIGFALSSAFALFINLVLQTFIPISLEVSRLGILGVSVMIATIAYAIVKQGFLDMRLFVGRALVFGLVVLLTAVIYIFALMTFFNLILGVSLELHVLFFCLIFTTIAVLTFPTILHSVSKYTDKVFFKQRYQTSELLASLSLIMAQEIDFDLLSSQLVQELQTQMRISQIGLCFFEHEKINDLLAIGYEKEDLPVGLLNFFPKAVWGNWTPVLHDQLPIGKNKELLRSHHIDALLPLIVEKELIGLLVLGQKFTGEQYYDRDIDLLAIFANEAAVALKNAQSYKQIQKFNKELEQMVEHRTEQFVTAHKRELEKAKEVSSLKDEFVFVAAHELKAPVFAINGFLELLTMSKTKLPKQVEEYLGDIHLASEHLTRLVNDLLQVAREDAGTLSADLEAVNLDALLGEILREQVILAKKRKIEIKTDVKDHVLAQADPAKLREVITNLINNAIKYNKEGGKIFIHLYKNGTKVYLEVTDTGHGIPKDQQKGIFGKFFRASGDATKNVMGTGLGLFITKMLVEKMGGKISFESTEGKGTTFTLWLHTAKKKKGGSSEE